jgi:hypothetical protein
MKIRYLILLLAVVLTPTQSVSDQRSNTLNFDDQLMEGMNRNPFDSLTHIGNPDDKNGTRLYRYKTSFKREILETAQEMGYVQ